MKYCKGAVNQERFGTTAALEINLLTQFLLQKLRQTAKCNRKAIRRFASQTQPHLSESPGDYLSNKCSIKLDRFTNDE